MKEIIKAINDGNSLEEIKRLITETSGFDFNSKFDLALGDGQEEKGITLLHLAVYKGRKDIVEFLLDKGAKIDEKNLDGNTPLMYAAFQNKPEIIKILKQRGADINVLDVGGQSAIEYALQGNAIDALEALIEEYFIVDKSRGITPLMYAIKTGLDPSVIEKLVLNCKDICAVDNKHNNALMYAIDKGINEKIINLILEKSSANKSILLNNADADGFTPLMLAITKSSNRTVEILLSNGAEINKCDRAGRTPLMWAAIYRNVNAAKLLITREANQDIRDKFGKTVKVYSAEDEAMLAIGKNQTGPLETLLRGKLLPSLNFHYAFDGGISTPLILAIKIGNRDTIDWLLTKGATVDFRNVEGMNPLHVAIDSGCGMDIIEMLLAKSSPEHNPINMYDVAKRTPLHYAVQKGKYDVVKRLIKAGAFKNCKDINDQTPLHFAAQKGDLQMVELLLKEGVIKNIKDKSGKTPVDYAANDQIRKLISEYEPATANPALPGEKPQEVPPIRVAGRADSATERKVANNDKYKSTEFEGLAAGVNDLNRYLSEYMKGQFSDSLFDKMSEAFLKIEKQKEALVGQIKGNAQKEESMKDLCTQARDIIGAILNGIAPEGSELILARQFETMSKFLNDPKSRRNLSEYHIQDGNYRQLSNTIDIAEKISAKLLEKLQPDLKSNIELVTVEFNESNNIVVQIRTKDKKLYTYNGNKLLNEGVLEQTTGYREITEGRLLDELKSRAVEVKKSVDALKSELVRDLQEKNVLNARSQRGNSDGQVPPQISF